MKDIIIIGAGPAGMTAALYALRADKSVLLLEKENFGGQITYSPKLENYPSVMEISGSAFAEKMLEQVIAHGADIELAAAEKITDMGDYKIVSTEYGDFEGKAVIIATGSKHRHLGLEGEEELIGSGISFCAVCDGSFFAGKKVAVIGGGNTALQEAVMLSDLCSEVIIVQNLSFMTGEKKLLQILEKKSNVKMIFDTLVTSLSAEGGELRAISLKNTSTDETSTLELDGMFVAIGQQPENQPFAALTALDNYGYIIAGEDCLTDTAGVFVAGDCRTKRIRQVTTAASDGAVAALAACRYIDGLN
ncbi:MAG: FAD-dependent oxidoreductase [Clostridia bacterium]|nr:FAD-dependent oxidoreductase [Clostridia bacterium]